MIIKICKIHGELTKEKCFLFAGGKYYGCKKCRTDHVKTSIKKQKQMDEVTYKTKTKTYNKNNYEKKKQCNKNNRIRVSKCDTEATNKLVNSYIKRLLRKNGFNNDDITKELIELKKASILLKRTVIGLKNPD